MTVSVTSVPRFRDRGSALSSLFAPAGRVQTPQVPPKPTVTFPSSTMTGTARRPALYSSIRASSAGVFLTLMYSNATCRR